MFHSGLGGHAAHCFVPEEREENRAWPWKMEGVGVKVPELGLKGAVVGEAALRRCSVPPAHLARQSPAPSGLPELVPCWGRLLCHPRVTCVVAGFVPSLLPVPFELQATVFNIKRPPQVKGRVSDIWSLSGNWQHKHATRPPILAWGAGCC